MLRRVPIGSQRQGNREGRSGDSKDDSEREDFLEIRDADGPEPNKAGNHNALHDNADPFRLEAIDEETIQDAEQGTGKDWNRNHQSLIARAQMEVGRDQDSKGAQDHPDHEAEVEIQE